MRGLPFFRLVVPTILLVGYALLGWRVAATAHLAPIAHGFAWLLLALPFLAMLWLPLYYWRSSRTASSWGMRTALFVAYCSVGWISFLLTSVVLRDVLALAALLWRGSAAEFYGPLPSLAVIAGAWVLFFLGYVGTRRAPRVRHIDVPITNLPAAWRNFSIAQISDLHVGHSIRGRFVERVVKALEKVAPDLIAVTGDFADGRPAELSKELEAFRRLKPTSGMYYVTGNHEYYWGADSWRQECERLGMKSLANSHVVLKRQGSAMVVAGVNDYVAQYFPGAAPGDVGKAMAGAPAEAVRVLLAHQPRFISDAVLHRVDLQLSGHTHGGQFLPWTFVVGFFNPVSRGLRRFGATWIYVNPGTGYWGPPLRLGARAEITVLRLVA